MRKQRIVKSKEHSSLSDGLHPIIGIHKCHQFVESGNSVEINLIITVNVDSCVKGYLLEDNKDLNIEDFNNYKMR